MEIAVNGFIVDLDNKSIRLPAAFYILDMNKAMRVSKLYQRLATFEYISDNASDELNQMEIWNTACMVRETMDEQNMTEEEALEEICPGLVTTS